MHSPLQSTLTAPTIKRKQVAELETPNRQNLFRTCRRPTHLSSVVPALRSGVSISHLSERTCNISNPRLRNTTTTFTPQPATNSPNPSLLTQSHAYPTRANTPENPEIPLPPLPPYHPPHVRAVDPTRHHHPIRSHKKYPARGIGTGNVHPTPRSRDGVCAARGTER